MNPCRYWYWVWKLWRYKRLNCFVFFPVCVFLQDSKACMEDLNRLLRVEPKNTAALKLLQEVQKKKWWPIRKVEEVGIIMWLPVDKEEEEVWWLGRDMIGLLRRTEIRVSTFPWTHAGNFSTFVRFELKQVSPWLVQQLAFIFGPVSSQWPKDKQQSFQLPQQHTLLRHPSLQHIWVSVWQLSFAEICVYKYLWMLMSNPHNSSMVQWQPSMNYCKIISSCLYCWVGHHQLGSSGIVMVCKPCFLVPGCTWDVRCAALVRILDGFIGLTSWLVSDWLSLGLCDVMPSDMHTSTKVRSETHSKEICLLVVMWFGNFFEGWTLNP